MTILFSNLLPMIAAIGVSSISAPALAASPAAAPQDSLKGEISAPSAPALPPVELIKAADTPAKGHADASRISERQPVSDETAIQLEIAQPTIRAAEPPITLAPAKPAPSALSSQQILKAANDRMNETRSAKGGFVQADAYGQITTGDFYLRRPGRIRFEYAEPTPYLIVSDGATVAIEDKSLETVDRAPLAATPLKHFLRKDLDLGRDATVMDVRSIGGQHLIAIEDQGNDAIDGQLILQFDAKTYDMIGWITLDGAGNETRVTLIDVQTNIDIPARLFILDDPDDENDRRR